MSSALDTAVDAFLAHTELHVHRYGVPRTTATPGHASQSQLFAQETRYFDSYTKLTDALNRLMYLNELTALQNASADAVASQYAELLETVPPTVEKSASGVKKYLETQNNFVKTKTLLNNYLQISLPVLRSIHHASSITSTETSISANLAVLFSSLNANLDANINRLKSSYEADLQAANELNRLNAELGALLRTLEPKLKRINGINVEINELNEKLLSDKRQQIHQVDFNTRNMLQKYHSLTQTWEQISILCDFLPSLILCLPNNWYDDKELFQIIEDCSRISQSSKDIYKQSDLDFDDLVLKLDQA